MNGPPSTSAEAPMQQPSTHELELKLRVPPRSVHEVEKAVNGRVGATRTHLQAIYVDTPDRRLAAAGIGWRVRKEGRRWVQTLKADRHNGPDGLSRLEHNVVLTTRGRPAPDASLHAGTDVGHQLASALKAIDTPPAERFHTDIWRLARQTRVTGGTVELAFDRGSIAAADRRTPVCELEIELVKGRPHAVIATARTWVHRYGLWIDVATKAHRGAMLADDLHESPLVTAPTPALEPTMSIDAAVREMTRACLVQVMGNASAVAAGTGGHEHVHQARIGIRKLRTVFSTFGGHTPAVDPTWNVRLADIFARLGSGRDRLVVLAQWIDALREAGAPPITQPSSTSEDPGDIFRGADFNLLVLDLLDYEHGEALVGEIALLDAVSRELRALRRRSVRDPKRFPGLPPTQQHAVRKKLKRLRYVAELTSALYDRKKVNRYVKCIAPAQEALGVMNDLTVASELYRAVVPVDSTAWFAVGWLSSRRDAAVNACVKPLRDAEAATPYWRH